jgi:hypothetical protein
VMDLLQVRLDARHHGLWELIQNVRALFLQ